MTIVLWGHVVNGKKMKKNCKRLKSFSRPTIENAARLLHLLSAL